MNDPLGLTTAFFGALAALMVYDLMAWLVALILWSFFPQLRDRKNAD